MTVTKTDINFLERLAGYTLEARIQESGMTVEENNSLVEKYKTFYERIIKEYKRALILPYEATKAIAEYRI